MTLLDDLRSAARTGRRAHRPGRRRRRTASTGAAPTAGPTAAVLRPASTAEVAAAVRLCHEAGVALVPQGGNTGLCGGAVPDSSGDQVVLSLGRMRAVRALDTDADTVTVEAGVVLADLQRTRRGRGPAVPAVARRRGQLHRRRQPRDQRRRHGRAALRHDARPHPRARGGAGRRTGVGRAAAAAQGQHRLRPHPALRRVRGHARGHHRSDAQAVPRDAPPGHRVARAPRRRGRNAGCCRCCGSGPASR